MIVHALVMLAATAATAAADDVTAADLATMQGPWMVASMRAGAVDAPREEAESLFRTVEGDKYSIARYSRTVVRGTFKLDATKSPKTIDSTLDTPGAKPILGIYEFDGARLRICNSQPGKPRPADFKPRLDTTLIVWEREPQ